MPTLKIAILGASPASCTLARLLHRRGIVVTIFEGEDSLNYRVQGGTLDLHTKTGLAALKDAGLYDNFLKYARFDCEAIIIADKKLLKYVSAGGGNKSMSRGRPEIDRQQLRKILLDSLPEGIIQWGHHVMM